MLPISTSESSSSTAATSGPTSEGQGLSSGRPISRSTSPQIHAEPGVLPAGGEPVHPSAIPRAATATPTLHAPSATEGRFDTAMSTEQMRSWLSANGIAVGDPSPDGIRATFQKAANERARPQHWLGRSLLNPEAGLYLHRDESEALVITTGPTGDAVRAEPATMLENRVDLVDSFYHLLDRGKVEFNHGGRVEIQGDTLHIDPYRAPTEASVEALSLKANELLERLPADLGPQDYRSDEKLGEGYEKQVFPLNGREDAVLLLLKPENGLTGGTLTRKVLEMEIHSLRRLGAMGLPVPQIKSGVLMVRTAHGEIRWGYLQGNLTGAIKSWAEPAPHLNQRSVEDARHWKQTLQERSLHVGDLELLVPQDGRLIGVDPKSLDPGPSDRQLKLFDDLIEAAQAKLAAAPPGR